MVVCWDFDLGLHCLFRLYYIGLFRVNMVVCDQKLYIVKTSDLVHLCNKQLPLAHLK